MFGKKKKQIKTLMHPKLGELKFGLDFWEPTSKTKLALWNRVYDVSLWFVAENIEENINQNQETAFEQLNKIIVEQKCTIEKLILEHSEAENEKDADNRFIPKYIVFSRNGECALFCEDTTEGSYDDDLNAGFAVLLIPQLIFTSSEECFDFMF